jgi:3-methylcrotonyl-CoA carboxylase beta subunit
MCGRAFSPNFLWTWPNAKIAIMGSAQLSSVMSTVSSKASADSTAKLAAKIEAESQVMYGSARLWDDGILLPTETRAALGMGLAIAAESGWQNNPGRGQWGVFRM